MASSVFECLSVLMRKLLCWCINLWANGNFSKLNCWEPLIVKLITDVLCQRRSLPPPVSGLRRDIFGCLLRGADTPQLTATFRVWAPKTYNLTIPFIWLIQFILSLFAYLLLLKWDLLFPRHCRLQCKSHGQPLKCDPAFWKHRLAYLMPVLHYRDPQNCLSVCLIIFSDFIFSFSVLYSC